MNFQPPEYDDPRDEEDRMNDGVRAMLANKLGFSVEQQSGCPVIVEDGDAKPADLEHRVLWDEVVALTVHRDELLAAMEDMLNGWRYIRQTHGDLYGVGWDRAEEKAILAIKHAEGTTP
jgi:hypothetical protein